MKMGLYLIFIVLYIKIMQIPPPKDRKKWPFKNMVVGESAFFLFPEAELARIAVFSHARFYGKRFATRTQTEEGLRGIRVWRLS